MMSSASSSSTASAAAAAPPSWVIVGCWLVITLQLLRLAMDLVAVASRASRQHYQQGDNDSNSAASDNKDKSSTEKETSQQDTEPLVLKNQASQVTAPSSYNNNNNNNNNSQYGSIVSGDDEEQQQQQPLLLDDDNAFGESESQRHRRVRVCLFLTAYLVLTVLFGVLYAIVVAAVHHPSSSSSLYSNSKSLIFTSALCVLVDAIMLYRDVDKERYHVGQRFLHLTAVLVLWCLYALLWAVAIPSSTTALSTIDIVLLVAVTLALLLAILDGWMTTRLPQVRRQRRSSLTTTAKRRHLGRKAILVLLKPYFWPTGGWNKVRAITTWICVVASKACGLFSPLLLGWATTALAHEQYGKTIQYSCLYAVISFFGTTFKEGQSLVYLKVAQAAFCQLATTAFGHLHSLSLDWHLRKKLGEVLRAMDRGIAACDTLMKYLFLWLVPAMAECLVVCIIFASYFQYLPLALTVFYFVFSYILWTVLVTLWRKKFRKALVASDNEYHDIFTDSMVNFETVKFFTAEGFERKRFADAVGRYQAGSVSVQASLSFLNLSQQVILKACLATALSLAAWGIRQRALCCTETMGCESSISDCCLNVSNATCPGMQVGDFVAVLTYTLNLFAPLNFLGSVYNAIVMAIVDLTSMTELLAENPDVVDASDAIELPRNNMVDPDTAIEFDNVYFRYPTQPSTKGLKGLSFKMKRGTTTAIVGPTGAGKTTIGRLLFRFYDVLGGAVKVNGVDVRSVTQKSLRESIGVVPQAASLFNDTIRYNLLYGRRDATQQELEQAARDAQLLGFIESLDEGWDTVVGDRGLKLSGGEKQRAAIARCLLKDPPFVLLDEATSSLDTLTESSVQEALDRLGAERTVLVIAHRLGTIRNADQIIVLKDGVAAEVGTHDELLSFNGIYADMWNMQLHSTSRSSSQNNFGNFIGKIFSP